MPTRKRRSGAISTQFRQRPGSWKCRRNTASIFPPPRPACGSCDFADEVRAQKGNLGSFEELLKTADPNQPLQEFAGRFLVDRILVAAGTPKKIVDTLERLHFETGANGGFILGRGYSAMDNIREFVEYVVPELQRRGLCEKEICRFDAP